MVKVNYDSTTGEIKGFYPDFVKYESIPEPLIEVTEDTWHDCIANAGLRKVDLTNLSIVTYTPTKTLAEMQETKTAKLRELLAQTDYEAIKYAEGVITADKFANLKTAREAWRTAINSIQDATTVEEVTAVTYSTIIPTVD